MRDFANMAVQLDAHRADFPRDQVQGPRAGELKRRLVNLSAIDAVLTSNYMVKG